MSVGSPGAGSPGAGPPSWEEVLELVRRIGDSGVTEAHIELPGFSLHLSTGPMDPDPDPSHGAAARSGDGPPVAVPPTGGDHDGLVAVTAPLLGVFYRRPAPDQPVFVDVGDRVAPGDTVATIEVMKLFNTVESDLAGTVVEIVATDGALVEFGQPLLYLRPGGDP